MIDFITVLLTTAGFKCVCVSDEDTEDWTGGGA